MSPRCGRRPGGSGNRRRPRPCRRPSEPGCGGNASGGSSGNDSTSVGPALPSASALRPASSASSVRIRPIEAGEGAPAAVSAAATARASAATGDRRRDAVRTSRSIRHGGRRRSPGSRRRAAPTLGPRRRRRRRRRAARLELDDLVLRVGDPGVVHPEQLADERLADALEVAQGQVALVELAVATRSSMIRATIARMAGSSRDATASGPTPRRRRRA